MSVSTTDFKRALTNICLNAVIIDRDQSANEGVENATYKVGNVVEHYEDLDRYDMGERYTVRL